MSTTTGIHGKGPFNPDPGNRTLVQFTTSPKTDHSWLTIQLNHDRVTFYVGTMSDQEVIGFSDQFSDALMAMVTHREEKVQAELEALEQKEGK